MTASSDSLRKAAIVLASGYTETGAEGARRQQQLVEAAGGMRILGPNTIGLVNLTDDMKYSCTVDSDCGGGAWKCSTILAGKYCCEKTSDAEICGNGKDDDCDGNVDNVDRLETCNGIDDNCNGQTDEGYDLMTSHDNCGMCSHACTSAQT